MKYHQKKSLHTYLVCLCIGVTTSILFLGVGFFIFFINNVLGEYFHNDLEFSISQTVENLYDKSTLMEDIILRLRSNSVLVDYLSGPGLIPEGETTSETTQIVINECNLYSEKNRSPYPFVEEVYLYDKNGTFNHAEYYPSTSSKQSESDQVYYDLYKNFLKSGNDQDVIFTDKKLLIFYTLCTDNATTLGTVLIIIDSNAIEQLLGKIDEYTNSVWVILDSQGNPIFQNTNQSFSSSVYKEIGSKKDLNPYPYTLSGKKYVMYSQPLTLGLWCAAGIPEDHVTSLIFEVVFPYVVIMLFFLIVSVFILLTGIFKSTRPLSEIASKLQHVAEQDFNVSLPPYSSCELDTISHTFNLMTTTIKDLIQNVYEKQLIAMDRDIRLLQSQVNPHFVNNVLHALALKAKMDKNEDLYQLTNGFARLTQARLVHQNDDKITLAQEMEYVNYYLMLQKFRFEDKLNYQIQIHSQNLMNCLVPKLSIEMIVENAVIHGVEEKIGPGTVWVDITFQKGDIYVLIEDDGQGFTGQNGEVFLPLPPRNTTQKSNHIAINNVYKLMHHFYGEDYGIRIYSWEGTGTLAIIKIPKEESPNA